MTPRTRARDRMNVLLQMVTILTAALLLGQLWLFTISLEAIGGAGHWSLPLAAAGCSLLACAVVWGLIAFFLRTENELAKE